MSEHLSTVPPVGRFAPTPSGRMHLGNAFAALLCWLSAKSRGGHVLLRMENLDLQRTSADFAAGVMEDLAWLGLDWAPNPSLPGNPENSAGLDGNGVLWQGNRSTFYEKQVEKLDKLWLTYPCFCSRAQLHAAEAPHASDGNYIYNGRCRGLSPEAVAERLKARPAALRVQVPNETVSLIDGLQGPYSENLQTDCGDFILRRSDGVFAYQLAAPADDALTGVTEIVRGRDLLPSAPRQLWLMGALGLLEGRQPPVFIHLPLLLAPDGRRLAKRDADLDLGAIRAKIKGPERLVGLLAHLAGLLEKPIPVTAAELVPLFNWKMVEKDDIIIKSSILEGIL